MKRLLFFILLIILSTTTFFIGFIYSKHRGDVALNTHIVQHHCMILQIYSNNCLNALSESKETRNLLIAQQETAEFVADFIRNNDKYITFDKDTEDNIRKTIQLWDKCEKEIDKYIKLEN